MQKVNRQLIRLSLIGIASLLLILAINVADNTSSNEPSAMSSYNKDLKPSAYLHDSTFNIFDSTGKRSTLHAKKAYFYASKDAITIESPSFSTNSKSNDLLLTADTGFYHPSEQLLLLEGNVVAKQVSLGDNAWNLYSNTLRLDNQLGLMSTTDKITFTNAVHTFSSTGFEASLTDKEIKLLSRVRGKYVLSNN